MTARRLILTAPTWKPGKYVCLARFCAYAFVNFRHLNIGHNKVHALLAIALQLMMAAYVGYQALFLESGRVTLSLAGGADATGAAYTIAFISFYIILVLQHSTFKWKESRYPGTFLPDVSDAGYEPKHVSAIIAYPLIFLFF